MKLLLMLFLLSTTLARAENLSDLRFRVDTWLTNHFSLLNSRQNTYKTAHGKFFQGFITHSVVPNQTDSTTNDVPANQLTLHPSDQTENWTDLIPELSSENMAGAIKIDVYKGPTGFGWVVSVYVKYNGTIYRRVKAIGNEASSRDEAWRVFDPLIG